MGDAPSAPWASDDADGLILALVTVDLATSSSASSQPLDSRVNWSELTYNRNGLETRIYFGEENGLLKNERGEPREDPAEMRAARKLRERQQRRGQRFITP